MCQLTTTGRRVRRGWAILARWAARVTGQLPTAGWKKRQPESGYFVHRSPSGFVYLVTNQGTLALGRTDFSAAVWEDCAPRNEVSEARRHLPPDVLQISVCIP
jgi:hypothetical protein